MTVVLIVLVVVLMTLLIGILIVYMRKTGKICYTERGRKGNNIQLHF